MKRDKSAAAQSGHRIDYTAPETMPEAARSIVRAAEALVARDGLRGLTLQRLQDEHGVNKGLVWYYFGGKQGLLHAIMRDVTVERCAYVARDIEANSSDDQRVESFIEQIRFVIGDPTAYIAWFDLFPGAVREAEFRAHLRAMYRIWYESNAERFGVAIDDRRAEPYARVAAAVLDGLLMQRLTEDFDGESTLQAVRVCMRALLGALREATQDTAAEPGRESPGDSQEAEASEPGHGSWTDGTARSVTIRLHT